MELPINYNKAHWTKRKAARDEYVKLQKGKCYHCGAPLDGEPATEVKDKSVKKKYYPKGFFNNPVHLHHNHDTGMTIGAIHCHCNAVLWEYHGE